jgi:hypothetical protein
MRRQIQEPFVKGNFLISPYEAFSYGLVTLLASPCLRWVRWLLTCTGVLCIIINMMVQFGSSVTKDSSESFLWVTGIYVYQIIVAHTLWMSDFQYNDPRTELLTDKL